MRRFELSALLPLTFVACGTTSDATPRPEQSSFADAGVVAPTVEEHRYRSVLLSADPSDIASALSVRGTCQLIEYVGGTSITASGDCHSQGIARLDGTTVTSCQDRDAQQGILHFYPSSIDDYAESSNEVPQLDSPQDMQGDWDHPVVGQGLAAAEGAETTSLVPIVSSSSRSAEARVQLRDASGAVVCRFEHSAEGDDQHLGAASLFSVDDELHLAACSWDCDHFFVYRLDPSSPDCAPELLSQLAIADRDENRRPLPNSNDNNWGQYNSLALVKDYQGSLLLVAGHQGWLDTWRIEQALSPSPTFRKLAKAFWGRNQANHGGRGLFFEGMAIEQSGPRSFELWAAPHDYGSENCGGRECMRAVYRCPIAI